MDGRIRGIIELLGQPVAFGEGGGDHLGAPDGALYPFFGRREHQFGAQRREHAPPFHAHGLRHGQRHLITA